MAYFGNVALICARLSEIVYKFPYEIRRDVPKFFASKPQIATCSISKKDSRVLVVSSDDAIYIIFRGTVGSIRSWMQNLKIRRKRWGKGKVHRGFLDIYSLAKPFITNNLHKPGNRDKHIYITGHSQGGAVVFLTSSSTGFTTGIPTPTATYTFGQPRTGDKPYCRYCETYLSLDNSRVANNRDLVVGVPFVWNGYDHTRDYLHFNAVGTIKRHRQSAGQSWPYWSISDHKIPQYVTGAVINKNIII